MRRGRMNRTSSSSTILAEKQRHVDRLGDFYDVKRRANLMSRLSWGKSGISRCGRIEECEGAAMWNSISQLMSVHSARLFVVPSRYRWSKKDHVLLPQTEIENAPCGRPEQR
eukprot:scaffold6121_cov29-Tisochrysis_lutea.AAC.2